MGTPAATCDWLSSRIGEMPGLSEEGPRLSGPAGFGLMRQSRRQTNRRLARSKSPEFSV